ncbi:S8 family serine peptidase [Streptomyces sp. NPDC093568]|uniref:S8 family serine peptidase n=1 Tax=Streptomyces sp. NPDC093568 TaxID=3366041 RepID=UPI0037F82B70
MDPGLAELLARSAPEKELGLIVRFRDAATPAPPGLRVVTRTGTVATVRARAADVATLRDAAAVVSVKAPLLHGADVEEAADAPSAAPADEARRPDGVRWTGAGTVVGVIDWGLDFAHPDFRREDGGSRVLALWDQRPGSQPGSPAPYGYGRVYPREEIDRALATSDSYDVLGYHPADADPGIGAHGTHTASIAVGGAGAGGPAGMAPGADLVFVHLSTWGDLGPVDIGDSVALVEALDFVARVAGGRPLVVNCSLGQQRGPHDGRTLVEIAFDEFARSDPSPRLCVHSAGNYFARRAHHSGRLVQGRDRLVQFRVPHPPHHAALDLWYGGADRLAVTLLAPDGLELPLPVGQTTLRDGLGFAAHRLDDPNNGRNQLTLRLASTVPAGTWALRLTGIDIADGRYHAWLERPLRGGLPLVFTDPDPATTTGTVCHERSGLTVGALAPDGSLAPFSSSGPTVDGRTKPDLSAPGVALLAARSTPRGAPPGSGGLTRMSGTSMAAPQVTGAVALLYEAGVRDVETVRRLLTTTAAPPTGAPDQYRAGAGRLCTAAALAAGVPVPEYFPSLSLEADVSVTESIEETPDEMVPKGAFAFEPEDDTAWPRSESALAEAQAVGPADEGAGAEAGASLPEAGPWGPEAGAAASAGFAVEYGSEAETVLDEREFVGEAETMSVGLVFADTESVGRLVADESLGVAEGVHVVVDGRGGQPYRALYDTVMGAARAPAAYTVLAVPGRPVGAPPSPGDLLVRRSESGAVHVFVVTADGVLGRDRLDGLPAERGGPGGYVRVVDTAGARPAPPGGLARLLTGPEGLTAPMTVLLRPVAPGAEGIAEDTGRCAPDAYRYDGTDVFVPGTTPCATEVPPGMVRFVNEWLLPTFGRRRHGIVACRPITGGARKSLHAEGRAVDYYLDASEPADLAVATAIIDRLLAPDAAGVPDALLRRLGVQEIIWNRRIWSTVRDRGKPMTREYKGANPHTDHIHIGLHRPGARGETSYWRGCDRPGATGTVVAPKVVPAPASAPSVASRPAPGTAGRSPEGTNYVVYAGEIRTGGTIAWRNNNPGNIVAGAFTRSHGAIGANGRFAVFPDEETGAAAVAALLRTPAYNSSSIAQAIARYAPSFENDTPHYIAMVARWTGLDPSRAVSTLDDKELDAVVGAIRRMEGWRPGTVHTCASGTRWAGELLACP